MDGFAAVDKPAGPTSHDVVSAARRRWGTRRVGHAGTLDPFATGLLLLLVGRATRLAPYLVGLSKRYTGTMRLGVVTDSDDRTGRVIAEASAAGVTDAALHDAMQSLTGEIAQVPPIYSAKKIGGEPAHRRVRRGEGVALAPEPVTVFSFDVVRRSGADVDFEVLVGSGTYVRALARDLGEALGCGAHLTALRRTEVGPWTVDGAVPLAAIENGTAELLPPAAALPHLPHRAMTIEERTLIRTGRAIPGHQAETGPVALLAEEQLVAVAEPVGGALQPRVVLEG
jgi:tRNA pseudouridine55 synthase